MRTLVAIFGFVCFTFQMVNAQTSGTQNLGIQGGFSQEEASMLLADNNIATATATSSKIGTVAEQIQEARVKSNMSTEDLASKIGLTNDQVVAIEAGKSTPMRRIMVKIEKALNFTIIIDAEHNKMSTK